MMGVTSIAMSLRDSSIVITKQSVQRAEGVDANFESIFELTRGPGRSAKQTTPLSVTFEDVVEKSLGLDGHWIPKSDDDSYSKGLINGAIYA